MAEYAIPADVETVAETNEIIVQRAIMLTSDDARVYVRQCRKLGAGCRISKDGLEVTVVYALDSDGKISIQGDYILTEQDEIAFGFNPDELDATIQISFILYPVDAINKIVRLRQYDKWCEDFFGDE